MPQQMITVDAHVDTCWLATKFAENNPEAPTSNLRQGVPDSELRTEWLNESGPNVIVYALYLSDKLQDELTDDKVADHISDQIAWLRDQIYVHFGGFRQFDMEELQDARNGGYHVMLTALEGGRLIHDDLQYLRALHNRAFIRYLTLTHNRNTTWADSATDVKYHGGLTAFGHEVVALCNELGILVDVSHASDLTAHEAIVASRGPVIASHSGCRAVLDHPRNAPDTLIKMLASTGGGIGIPFARRFVGDSVAGFLTHVQHAVGLVGPDHVFIGSDMDGAALFDEFRDVRDWYHIVVDGLAKLKYSDEDIKKIAGENLVRLLIPETGRTHDSPNNDEPLEALTEDWAEDDSEDSEGGDIF